MSHVAPLVRATLANDDRSICSSPPVSDEIDARALFSRLPNVEWLLGNWGHDEDWFREALEDKGIRACIPGRKQRKKAVRYDQRRHKRRDRIEIMFGRLKDWRRVAIRYDGCPKVPAEHTPCTRTGASRTPAGVHPLRWLAAAVPFSEDSAARVTGPTRQRSRRILG
jgi:hypothetical protein